MSNSILNNCCELYQLKDKSNYILLIDTIIKDEIIFDFTNLIFDKICMKK